MNFGHAITKIVKLAKFVIIVLKTKKELNGKIDYSDLLSQKRKETNNMNVRLVRFKKVKSELI